MKYAMTLSSVALTLALTAPVMAQTTTKAVKDAAEAVGDAASAVGDAAVAVGEAAVTATTNAVAAGAGVVEDVVEAVTGDDSAEDEPTPEYLNAEADRDYGEYLAGECLGCHKINADEGGIPPINGHDSEWFITMMWEYKYELRENVAMRQIAKQLDPDMIASIAAYYSEIELE